MKNILLLGLFLSKSLFATSGPKNIEILSTAIGSVIQVSATSYPVKNFRVIADSLNSGQVCLGDSSINATNGICIGAGSQYKQEYGKPDSTRMDLSKLYLYFSSATDKALIHYWGQ